MTASLAKLTDVSAQARQATERRNALIVKLRADGVPLRTIAEAAGITHTAVAKIVAQSATPGGAA